jgi:hypothetical protein
MDVLTPPTTTHAYSLGAKNAWSCTPQNTEIDLTDDAGYSSDTSDNAVWETARCALSLQGSAHEVGTLRPDSSAVPVAREQTCTDNCVDATAGLPLAHDVPTNIADVVYRALRVETSSLGTIEAGPMQGEVSDIAMVLVKLPIAKLVEVGQTVQMYDPHGRLSPTSRVPSFTPPGSPVLQRRRTCFAGLGRCSVCVWVRQRLSARKRAPRSSKSPPGSPWGGVISRAHEDTHDPRGAVRGNARTTQHPTTDELWCGGSPITMRDVEDAMRWHGVHNLAKGVEHVGLATTDIGVGEQRLRSGRHVPSVAMSDARCLIRAHEVVVAELLSPT